MGNYDVIKDIGGSPFIEQIKRIIRWKKLLGEFKFSNSTETKSEHHFDFIYAFFINCYHLRDFLEYDKIISKQKLSEFFKDHIEMQICRDICNESKHRSLKNSSIGYIDDKTNKKISYGYSGVCLIREYDPFQEILKNKNPQDKIKYVILVRGEKYNVFELADKCLRLWLDFLRKNYIIDYKIDN